MLSADRRIASLVERRDIPMIQCVCLRHLPSVRAARAFAYLKNQGVLNELPSIATAPAPTHRKKNALSGEHEVRGGKYDCLVTNAECAGAPIPDVPLPPPSQGTRLGAGGVSPLSLLTFFAAAKKVSAAPHRGSANRPP